MTILWRHQIAAVYNNDPVVLGLASHLLLFAATYQITDAVQVVSVGILRGYNDTRAILCVTLVSYWMLALPQGYTLGRTHLWGDRRPAGSSGRRLSSAYPSPPSFWSAGCACWSAVCFPGLIGSRLWKGEGNWGGKGGNFLKKVPPFPPQSPSPQRLLTGGRLRGGVRSCGRLGKGDGLLKDFSTGFVYGFSLLRVRNG